MTGNVERYFFFINLHQINFGDDDFFFIKTGSIKNVPSGATMQLPPRRMFSGSFDKSVSVKSSAGKSAAFIVKPAARTKHLSSKA